MRTQRQGNIDRRRLEAIDQLWAAIKILYPLRANCATMSVVRWPEAAEGAHDDPRAREMFAAVSANLPDQFPNHEAHASRLYISPLAWALFNAYQATLAYAYVQMVILRTGVGPKYSDKLDSFARMLIVALPDWEERITELGQAVLFDVASELEDRLLRELQRNLEGRDDDQAEIERAAKIIKLASQAEISSLNSRVTDSGRADLTIIRR